MSSIAEFYSANLATEAKKGMREKAKRGGTPGLTPFGYNNIVFKDEQGREVHGVETDPERADAVKWIYATYNTGNWTVRQVATELEKRGVRTRPTPNRKSNPLSANLVYKILKNRYYLGIISFEGTEYPGQHEALIDETTWQTAQDIAAARLATKSRPAQHPHYLKGSVFCAECGSRLGIQHVRNHQGVVYPYFYCLARQKRSAPCGQRAIMVGRVEQLVEDHWRSVSLSPAVHDRLRDRLKQHIRTVMPTRGKETARAKAQIAKLDDQRDKLMTAHYAEAVPLDLLRSEQSRIGRERADAEERLDAATRSLRELDAHVEAALTLLTNAHNHYRAMDDLGRQLLNQALFEAIWTSKPPRCDQGWLNWSAPT
jgi:hypothetical protein